jgi:plastocyanin
MPMKRATAGFLFLAVTSPALLGAKCVDFDDRFAQEAPAPGASDASAGAGDGNAAPVGVGNPCSTAGQAQLLIKNRKFNIECGCAEADGFVCTVPVGTKVVWSFVDSEEHVVSGGPEIGKSAEQLIGRHEATFNSAGTYRYSCSIHANMKGYSIVVR